MFICWKTNEINGLPTPVTSRHAQGHGILHHYLVVCSSQSEQTTERNEYYMVNQQHGGNRWVSAVIPALLIHISIGTVYCWSVFKQLIADQMHVAPGIVEWGFSLAIFFLGMSAAFLGPFVEKDIKKSALISTVCFACRFAGTGASIAAGCPRRAHLLWRNHGHWIGRRLSDAGEEPNAVVRQRSRHRHRRRGIRSGQGHRGKHQRHPDRRCRVQRCRRCLSSTLA